MKSDMNPHAVTMRLKKVSELRRLCIALGGDRLKAKLHNSSQIQTKVIINQHNFIDEPIQKNPL